MLYANKHYTTMTILTAQKIKFSMLINTYSSKAQEVISTLYSKLMSYPLLKYNCSLVVWYRTERMKRPL